MDHNITSVTCTLATDEEIRAYCRINIKDIDNYISPLTGASTPGGKDCIYCNTPCFGHISYIESPGLLCNPIFVKYINKLLQNICVYCVSISDSSTCNKCYRNIKHISLDKNISLYEVKQLLMACGSDLHRCITDKIILVPRMMMPSIIDVKDADKQFYNKHFIEACLHNKIPHKEYKDMICNNRFSIMSFIKGKKGIIRKYMVGKRVNRCGRAVIVGSDLIDFNTVLVPKDIFDCLRPVVLVTNDNMDYLKQLSVNGSLYSVSGERIHVSSVISGRVYKRDLDLNDIVILNRQPSLSKGSIMGFRPICSDNKVITINTVVTGIYGADFDGDEMNIYSKDNIDDRICAENNIQFISFVQDSVTVYYKYTSNIIDISRQEYTNAAYICESNNILYIDNPNTLHLLSLPFPNILNMDGECVIRDGIILSGTIKSSTLKDIIKILYIMRYDIVLFVRSMHRLVSHITSTISMISISLNDLILDTSVKNEYFNMYADAHIDDIDIVSNNISNLCAGYVIDNINKSNLTNMIYSGSKGNIDDAVDITFSVRYQKIKNKVIPNGCCRSSYMEGLTPNEYFYHMMSSREGIVAVNVKTSDIGYIGRKMCKTLSECVVTDRYAIREFNTEILPYVSPSLDINRTILSSVIF